jgi:CRISPR-associated exonuclease Cas4
MNTAGTQGIYITPSEVIEYLYCPRFIYYMNCLCIPQHEEQRYKVIKGRELHEEKKNINKAYVRKKLKCVDKDIDVYMSSDKYHLKGVVDEVLYLEDGTLSPLDYKFAEYREKLFKTHKYQSVLYALLIKENYQPNPSSPVPERAGERQGLADNAFRAGNIEVNPVGVSHGELNAVRKDGSYLVSSSTFSHTGHSYGVKKGFVCYTRSRNLIKEIKYSEKDFETAINTISEILKIIQSGHYPKKTKYLSKCIDCCYRNICV